MSGSGFGFQDDELQKLFADATAVVKKARQEDRVGPPAASVSPVAAAEIVDPSLMVDLADSPPAVVPVTPAPSPPPPPAAPRTPVPAGAEQLITGGSMDDSGIEVRGSGGYSGRIPWAPVRSLCLGRIPDGQSLALNCGQTMFYFIDNRTDYRGLLTDPAPSGALNWRKLVENIALAVGEDQDPGIQAVKGIGGMIPKFESLDDFLKHARNA